MPQDEVSPDQRVRATSSRRQTTNALHRSPSVRRVSAIVPLTHDGRTSSNRHLEYQELLALREFGKTLSDDRRMWACGYKVPRGNAGDANEIRKYTRCCDRPWVCPVCGYHTARNQSRKLVKRLKTWTRQGGSVLLLTLTQSHSIEDELETLWRRADAGWRALKRRAGWHADRKSFGIRGDIRITEVVHQSDSGWNVHFHVLLLLDRALDDRQLCELKARLTGRYMNGIRAVGGQVFCAGQNLTPMRSGTERQIARYYAKGTRALWSSNSRTPMAILADLKETGEGIGLWKEFSAAVTGTRRRRVSPSWGIANLVPVWPVELKRKRRNLARPFPVSGEADAIS